MDTNEFTEYFIGKKIIHIERQDDEILFIMSEMENGKAVGYKMYHAQDCCESVCIVDICGDFDDLIDTEILVASERTSNDFNAGPVKKTWYSDENFEPDSCTWTFYEIGTIKGSVTIAWLGDSNGYYSESVNIEKYTVDIDQED